MGDDFPAGPRVVSDLNGTVHFAIDSFDKGRRPVEAEVRVGVSIRHRAMMRFLTSIVGELSAANPDRAKLLGRP
jgi:hypothetical protein